MLANIQMLRAMAALMVVLHHIGGHYVAMGGSALSVQKMAQWGFTGVDMFFVISGFIMAHTTFGKERTLPQALQFAGHRLGRIYLGYWSFCLLAMLMALHYRPGGWPTRPCSGRSC